MMPVSPASTGTVSGLTFSAINHYCSPSKSVTFDPLPSLRSGHPSYCSFNSLGREDGLVVHDEEFNDSDSETYWGLGFISVLKKSSVPECLEIAEDANAPSQSHYKGALVRCPFFGMGNMPLQSEYNMYKSTLSCSWSVWNWNHIFRALNLSARFQVSVL